MAKPTGVFEWRYETEFVERRIRMREHLDKMSRLWPAGTGVPGNMAFILVFDVPKRPKRVSLEKWGSDTVYPK